MQIKVINTKKQRGVSLVTAIFLMVVLATLGAMMATFFASQQQSSALDVQGSRAYQAARAGVEWGTFQVIQVNGGAYAAGCRAGPVAPNLPALAGSLAGFTVQVTCTYNSIVENGVTIGIYRLVSLATAGGAPGNPDYVERQITATIENSP